MEKNVRGEEVIAKSSEPQQQSRAANIAQKIPGKKRGSDAKLRSRRSAVKSHIKKPYRQTGRQVVANPSDFDI